MDHRDAEGGKRTRASSSRPDLVLKFDNSGRHDQIANSVEEHGWTEFERPLPEFLVAAVRRWPGLFMDVGCNTGFYTLLAASAEVRSRVLAFEPVEAIRAIAQRNADLNGVAARVRLSGQAIGDRNGSANLYIPPDDHGLVETSASLNPHFKSSHIRQDTVPVRRLDRALLLSGYRWRKVSVIKIDVEGHEAAVLKGARWIVRLYRPVIFLEVLQAADFVWLNRFVAASRYVPYRLQAKGPAVRSAELKFDMQAWNQALVPVEKIQAFEALAALI